ncbi:amidohydrolase family protein [Parafrankia sp. FMc6]|uniref:amidohydrolase family protein n=1 Tax=Parafrankia soli TaxID=2599596 RepID=UPI0034D5485D
MDLDFDPIDADNHYYEPLDAFTRHLDRRFNQRGVQVVSEGRRTRILIGGRINQFIPNPTFDPIIVPGCLDSLFRGQVPADVDPRALMAVEPLRSEYQNRDHRAALAERQGLGAVLLFPTLGCGVEEALKHDVDATMASLAAFNRWLEEDWGFVFQHRLVSAPMLSLADPVAAVAELDRVIERGARIVHIRPAPVPGEHGTSRSLGDPVHDPVWARLAEASIPAAFHLGDSGYNAFTSMWGGTSTFQGFGKVSTLSKVLVSDRAIHDTVASLVVDGVFTRFPTLRVASIENGSDWVSLLVKRLRKQANQTPWDFPEDPLEVIRRNVWVTPYYEEDLAALADLIGVERVLFGSDWPHGEGLAEPTDFLKELHGFDEVAVRKIMRDNALELLGVESV